MQTPFLDEPIAVRDGRPRVGGAHENGRNEENEQIPVLSQTYCSHWPEFELIRIRPDLNDHFAEVLPFEQPDERPVRIFDAFGNRFFPFDMAL